MLKPLALVPMIFSLGAVIIGMLCIFAGHTRTFMPDYSILTVNTSRIGQNLVQQYLNPNGSSPLAGILNDLPSAISNDIENHASSLASSIAKELGVADFYSVHSTDYCEGYYTPGPIANATLKASAIHMNVTNCTSLARADFVPGDAIQATLDRTGTGLTLADLDWNSEIDTKVRSYQKYIKAFLILYSIGVGLAFFTFLLSIVWFLAGHRGVAAGAGVLAFLSFLAIGIASGLLTAVYVLGQNAINKYGGDIGVQANTNHKLLALSWAGCACALVASLVGCFGICCGAARRNRNDYGKNDY